MLFYFPNMEETITPHFKGGEKSLAVKGVTFDGNKITMGRLEPGASIGVHTHEDSCEVYYYISGKGKCFYDGAWEPAEPGCAHFCPKGHSHGLSNTGDEDLIFLGAVIKQ